MQIANGIFFESERNSVAVSFTTNEQRPIKFMTRILDAVDPNEDFGKQLEPELPFFVSQSDFKTLLEQGYTSWQQDSLKRQRATERVRFEIFQKGLSMRSDQIQTAPWRAQRT